MTTMEPILTTYNLSKSYGALLAVDEVNLTVRPGTIHSIIGPNGAGKTTLFNLLTGFVPPSSGMIIYRNKDITNRPSHEIAHLGIARSFQITSVFPDLPVLENVRIALQAGTGKSYRFFMPLRKLSYLQEKAEAVLERINLLGKKDVLARHLSHGERKVLDIGISLATDPQLLLMDEPAAGLVGDEISRLSQLIGDIAANVTVVLIEHNIDVVLSMSHTITVLHQGSVIAEGTPEAIRSDRRVQEAYLGGYEC